MPKRYTGRARSRSGPARSRPPWLRVINSLQVTDSRPVDHWDPARVRDKIIDHIQREYDEAVDAAQQCAARIRAEQARQADERSIMLLGHARPLPRRKPAMPENEGTPIPPGTRLVRRQRHAELAEALVIDPVMWAEAFKATWSVGADVAGMAEWFRDAMAAALAADKLDRRGDPTRFPNRYEAPAAAIGEQQRAERRHGEALDAIEAHDRDEQTGLTPDQIHDGMTRAAAFGALRQMIDAAVLSSISSGEWIVDTGQGTPLVLDAEFTPLLDELAEDG